MVKTPAERAAGSSVSLPAAAASTITQPPATATASRNPGPGCWYRFPITPFGPASRSRPSVTPSVPVPRAVLDILGQPDGLVDLLQLLLLLDLVAHRQVGVFGLGRAGVAVDVQARRGDHLA